MPQKIDVVIPIASKDIQKAHLCIKNIVANSLTPINNIYIITKKDVIKNTSAFHFYVPVVWIDESEYSFSLEDIKTIFNERNNQYKNASWYYQQLLKFYVFKAIPNLQSHTLILDVDFFVSQKTRFLTDDGKANLAYGYPFKWLLNTKNYPSQNNHTHIDFAKRLIPNWETVNSFSGMHHHMLFQKQIVEKLFLTVEEAHQKNFWQAFIDNLAFDKWNAASEYIIYYHFAAKLYPNYIISRHLKSCDFIHDAEDNNSILEIANNTIEQGEFNTVGCHSFLNLRERLKTMDYIPTDLREEMLSKKRIIFKLILDDGLLQIEAI